MTINLTSRCEKSYGISFSYIFTEIKSEEGFQEKHRGKGRVVTSLPCLSKNENIINHALVEKKHMFQSRA